MSDEASSARESFTSVEKIADLLLEVHSLALSERDPILRSLVEFALRHVAERLVKATNEQSAGPTLQ